MANQGQPNGKRKIGVLLAVVVVGALILSSLIVFAVYSASYKPVPTPTVPAAVTPHYLLYPSGGVSRIFLISATSTYGTYPFASPASSIHGGLPVIQKGDPCFIINATIRNDYTLENPPPNQATLQYPNGTISNETASVYVFLTAQIYDKQGLINATDVTPPYGFPNGGAFVYLQNGENATLTIYLATSRQDIIQFEVIPKYIGAIAPP